MASSGMVRIDHQPRMQRARAARNTVGRCFTEKSITRSIMSRGPVMVLVRLAGRGRRGSVLAGFRPGRSGGAVVMRRGLGGSCAEPHPALGVEQERPGDDDAFARLKPAPDLD